MKMKLSSGLLVEMETQTSSQVVQQALTPLLLLQQKKLQSKDSLEQVKSTHGLVYNRAIITKDMPLGNLTKMTDDERQLLAGWLEQNKPGS